MSAVTKFPPPEDVYKRTSVYKATKSRVCCIPSVYISVYEETKKSADDADFRREMNPWGRKLRKYEYSRIRPFKEMFWCGVTPGGCQSPPENVLCNQVETD